MLTRAGDRILVLDGETRAALAIVRSLGKHKIDVGVAAHHPGGIAQKSKYASTLFECPDPVDAPEMYLKWVAEVVETWAPRMILPITDASLTLCLRIEEVLRARTILPTVDRNTLAEITDKGHLLRIAAELGIKTPRSHLLPPLAERSEADQTIIEGFSYPAVLKPNTSVSDVHSHFVKGGVHYPEDAEDVSAILYGDHDVEHEKISFLLQERIEGVGIGVFALCNEGEPLTLFAHRRILEKPPSGGRSVLSESIPLTEAPVDEALALFRHFRMQGVAMAEFKRTADGSHYLMEINPRFWGSLQLAIDSGRDFPAMLSKLYQIGQPFPEAALKQFTASIPEYQVGQRLRWELGSLDHFLINCKREFSESIRQAARENALQFFVEKERTRTEVCRRDDLQPFLYEMRRYVRELFSSAGGDY
jgi:predicted ATP-grasp superfamily ATP-dependent carboligase